MTTDNMPPLPEWSKQDDLGRLVPSEVRMELQDYARAYAEQETKALREALEIALQAFSEMHHARTNPSWFTKGEAAAREHWFTWERKGIDTVRTALGIKP